MFQKIKNKYNSLKIAMYLRKHNLIDDNKIFTHLTLAEKITLHKTIKSINYRGEIACAEIGSYLGASSCFIANALNSKSILYCIDTWENDSMIYREEDMKDENLVKKNTFEQFRFNTRKYINSIKILRGWSYNVVNDLKKNTENLDFIFIDGDQSYKGVKKDWDLYKVFFKKGTVICFHDISWADGVNKLIAEEVKHKSQLKIQLQNMAIYQIV